MPQDLPPLTVAVETDQAARRFFNLQYIYIRIGDEFCKITAPLDLPLMDPTSSWDTVMIARMALVTCFQFVEALPDALAAEATIKRMDWKYALRMPLFHPGIRVKELCNFRQNLMCSPAGLREFGALLAQMSAMGLLSRTTHSGLTPLDFLNGVCTANRVYLLRQAMQMALSKITSASATILRGMIRPHWYAHYQTTRFFVVLDPISNETTDEANTLGADIHWLLTQVEQSGNGDLMDCTELRELRSLWHEQFQVHGEQIIWRVNGCETCPRHYSIEH